MIRALASCALLCHAVISFAAEFHISPGGRDDNPGSAVAPFATLERARDMARAARQSSPQESTTLWLHAGEYHRSKALELDAQDSGSANAPLFIAAAPGERVVLSGATHLPVSAFGPLTDAATQARIVDAAARSKVLVADLKALGVRDFGELSRHGFSPFQRLAKTPPVHLYVEGMRQTLARWPNPDEDFSAQLSPLNKPRRGVIALSRIIEAGPARDDADFTTRGGSFEIASDRLKYWKQAHDIWLDGIFGESWEWSYNRVASLDPGQRRITLAYGEVKGVMKSWVGDYFFAENLLEEIDRPGEWYLDRISGLLYLYPPAQWHNSARVELATLAEPIFRLNGARHVRFDGLTLEMGRDWALTVEGGEDVVIRRSQIRHFSQGGVRLKGLRHGVSHSELAQIGGSVLTLDCGDKRALASGGCFADDNHIHDWGWYHKVYTGAANLDGVGQRVAHNHIHHAPHGAVYLSGNDHRVEYNDFHHLLRDFVDMGIVYGAAGNRPLERGHLIRRNYFHDFGQAYVLQHAVYPDNLVQGWTIEENLFVGIGNANLPYPGNHAIRMNSPDYVTVRHNLFIDCAAPVVFSKHAATMVRPRFEAEWRRDMAPEKIAALPHLMRYPELAGFWQQDRSKPTRVSYQRNLVWNPSQPLRSPGSRPNDPPYVDGAKDELGTLQRADNWQASGLFSKGDPGFVDAAKGDYRLRADAELRRRIPDFPAFDLSAIGPRQP